MTDRGLHDTTSPRPGRHGFTLLEVLVSAAILGMVLAVLGRTLGLGRAVSVEIDATVEQHQARSLVEELLRYDLGSAGFVRPGLEPEPLPMGIPLVVRRHRDLATGDEIVVRYVEDRDIASPRLRDYVFSAGIDGRGETQLYRREGGGTRQPLVAGLASLRVIGIARGGRWHSIDATAADAPSADAPSGGAPSGGAPAPHTPAAPADGPPADGPPADGPAGAGEPSPAPPGSPPVAGDPSLPPAAVRADGLRLWLAFAWGETVELVVTLPSRPIVRIEGG